DRGAVVSLAAVVGVVDAVTVVSAAGGVVVVAGSVSVLGGGSVVVTASGTSAVARPARGGGSGRTHRYSSRVSTNTTLSTTVDRRGRPSWVNRSLQEAITFPEPPGTSPAAAARRCPPRGTPARCGPAARGSPPTACPAASGPRTAAG